MIRCYPTTCRRHDCAHEAWLDSPANEPRLAPGDDVACDCGDDSTVAIAMPRTIGIVTDHYDPQTGLTFSSNRAYEDWKNYGHPIYGATGEVSGHPRMREYSHAELDQQMQAGWAEQEAIAREAGLTLEQAAARKVADINAKRAKEIEAGLTPTVREQKVADLLPA